MGAAVAVAGLAAGLTRWRTAQLAVFVAFLACGVTLIESTRTIRDIHGSIVRDLQPVWYLVVAINPWLMALALPSLLLYRRSMMRAQLVAEARIDARTGLLNAVPGGGKPRWHSPGRSVTARTWRW